MAYMVDGKAVSDKVYWDLPEAFPWISIKKDQIHLSSYTVMRKFYTSGGNEFNRTDGTH